jgi:hypothetical protein
MDAMKKWLWMLVVVGVSAGWALLAVNPSFAGAVDLPQTGQTTCYDASGNVIPCPGTGQDGEIQAGVAWPEPRFTSNGDGTVTDNLTGLMWLKDANCLGYRTWQGALDKVADLNANPGSYTCGGYRATYTDWSLPNVNELESLYNAEVPDLATWLNGKEFLNVHGSGVYWSSTTSAFDAQQAWRVSMGDGAVTRGDKSPYSAYVWAVRGVSRPPAAVWKTGQIQSYAAGDDGALQRGVPWPEPRFTDHGDGTVTDNLTGLMWLRDANCFFGSMHWQEALDKVADLNANPAGYSCSGYSAAYTDWRLPNRKERQSLTDFSQYYPPLPQGHPFLNVQSFSYWSSTTSATSTDYAWVVSMDSGHVNLNPKFAGHYVWPVRAGQSGSLVHLDIRANGSDGPITVSPSTPVAIDISLNPGDEAGVDAEWWIVVQSPLGIFWHYYSYVYPSGWVPGIDRCIEMPLTHLGSTNVLNMPLPPGTYRFFFVLDDQIDWIPDGKWMDSVNVTVE